MNCFQIIKLLIVLLIGWFVLFVVGPIFGIIQFHYPRAVENDPLRSPIKVLSVSGNTLVLDDGRTFRVEVYDKPLDEIVRESHFRVDMESESDGSGTTIYAARRGWICGTPWAAMIQIPLFPDKVSINRREMIGTVHVVSQSDEGSN